jgi:hypothetical protein
MARSKSLKLLPLPNRDVKKAYEWYEEQMDGLGAIFLERVEECLNAIRRIQALSNPSGMKLGEP